MNDNRLRFFFLLFFGQKPLIKILIIFALSITSLSIYNKIHDILYGKLNIFKKIQ